jgi:hypothetical protein
MGPYRAYPVLLWTRLTRLVNSNLFGVLLVLAVFVGLLAKFASPDALQTRQSENEGSSASVVITDAGECRELKFENSTGSITNVGAGRCRHAEGGSDSRFVAISKAFRGQ